MNGEPTRVVIADDHPVYREGLGIEELVVIEHGEHDDADLSIVGGDLASRLKDDDDDQIARVIHGIARGEAIFGPRTADRLLDLVAASTPRPPVAARAFPNLTAREVEVLELMARGRRDTEIATQLSLSDRTVRNYVSNILSKLHSVNRGQAIAAARDAGLGNPPP